MKLKLTKLIASTIALAIMSTVAIAEDGEEKKGKKKGKGKPAAERPERPKRPDGSRPERSPEEMIKSLKERLANNEKFAEMFTKRNMKRNGKALGFCLFEVVLGFCVTHYSMMLGNIIMANA